VFVGMGLSPGTTVALLRHNDCETTGCRAMPEGTNLSPTVYTTKVQ